MPEEKEEEKCEGGGSSEGGEENPGGPRTSDEDSSHSHSPASLPDPVFLPPQTTASPPASPPPILINDRKSGARSFSVSTTASPPASPPPILINDRKSGARSFSVSTTASPPASPPPILINDRKSGARSFSVSAASPGSGVFRPMAAISEVATTASEPRMPANSATISGGSISPRTKGAISGLTRHGSLVLDKSNGIDTGLHRRHQNLRQTLRAPEFLRQRLHGSRGKVRNRLVQKHGECNISLVNIPKQRAKYIVDIFTTLVDVKWRWCLLFFALGFILSWLFFALIYYLIVYAHGDLYHVSIGTKEEDRMPCISGVVNFASIFIFSCVSQHTIGYGKRYPTEKCPEVIVIMSIQAMVGVLIQTLMAGVVFAKLARPKRRADTLIFSKNAVICMRDGELCLLFRVGDMRRSQLAEAHIRLQMIKKRITAEGELLPFHQYDMNVGYDTGLDRIFVVWPIGICHVIDETSPLYGVSARDLHDARFEIIVILEGVVQSTGSCTQAKTSYLPSEVLWGHRFEKLVTYQRENGEYRIDFSRFHNTYPINIPTCSAKQLAELRGMGSEMAPLLGGSRMTTMSVNRLSPGMALRPSSPARVTAHSSNAALNRKVSHHHLGHDIM